MTEAEAETRRQRLFEQIRAELPVALELHQQFGLFEVGPEGQPGWSNVSEHCLIEAARVGIFAQKLSFAPELRAEAILAAALHDFNKRYEIEGIKKEIETGGSGLVSYERTSAAAIEALRQRGLTERVIRLVGATGGRADTLFAIRAVLDKTKPTDEEIAMLVTYYVDSYTRGSDWVEPAVLEAGKWTNEVDRRLHKILTNPNYRVMNEATIPLYQGHPGLSGKDTFQIMVELGHEAEGRLVKLIQLRSQEVIEPWLLPERIDAELQTNY